MILLENEIMESNDLVNESATETKLGDQIISEALIQDALAESNQTVLDEDVMAELLSEELLSERNILKWDKWAKRKYATNKSVLVIAKKKNDRDFKKLVTVMKMRRKLLDRLAQKYGNKAKIRARKMEQNHGIAKAISDIKSKANIHVAKHDQPDMKK